MNKKYLIYVLVPIAIALAIVFVFFKKNIDLPINNTNNENSLKVTYLNTEYGFSFDYPDTYQVDERVIDNVNRIHKVIILLPKGFIPPEGGEGPTTINLDIYQNNLDKLSIERWVKETSNSNYKLGDGKLTSTSVDGLDALTYNWDGLYRGQTIVFAYKDNIYAMSVTYMTSDDQILKDFDLVYNSFNFIDEESTSKLPQTLIENYLKENISSISPEKEVLGGKFYITDLKLIDSNSGVVSYEDGHVAFVADFNYIISPDGKITISSFVIRK